MTTPYPTKRLGELCHIARGGSPRPIQSYLTDAPDGLNWIKISDATASDKYIEFTKEKIRPEGLKKSRLVKPGDFILSNSMSFGRPYIMKTTGCIHDGWLVLSDKCGLFDQDYLYHFLGSDAAYRQFDKLAAGSTVRNLNSELVKTVDVPLPSLDDQRRIVAVLDKAFAAITAATANAEKNVANAHDLFRSALDKNFAPVDWARKHLIRLTSVFDDGDWIESKDQSPDGIRLIQIRNVGDGYFKNRSHKARYISRDTFKRLRCTEIFSGDCLVSRLPDPVGRACVLPEIDERMITAVDCTIIRFDADAMQPEFFCYFAQSSDYAKQIALQMTGATRMRISRKNLGLIEIPTPPAAEQRTVISRLNELRTEVERFCEIELEKISAFGELKQSLLAQAFSGDLPRKEIESIAA